VLRTAPSLAEYVDTAAVARMNIPQAMVRRTAAHRTFRRRGKVLQRDGSHGAGGGYEQVFLMLLRLSARGSAHRRCGVNVSLLSSLFPTLSPPPPILHPPPPDSYLPNAISPSLHSPRRDFRVWCFYSDRRDQTMKMAVSVVLEVDLRKFFDSLEPGVNDKTSCASG